MNKTITTRFITLAAILAAAFSLVFTVAAGPSAAGAHSNWTAKVGVHNWDSPSTVLAVHFAAPSSPSAHYA
jgi:hypothetical protein